MNNQALKVIVSGGGTGGHIFPALAIANAIKESYPTAEILFVGAKGKMEMEKVPKAGYPIRALWISGIQRKLSVDNLLFPFKLISSLWNAYKIIRTFKPNLAIGVGGFASGPLLQVATWCKVPSLIHESNSYPGITNKILGRYVQKICVAFSGMEKYFPKDKLIITGNPIRKNLLSFKDKKLAYYFFNLSPNHKTVLVIGGSQGAESINKAIAAHLIQLNNLGIQILWQTGKSFYSIACDLVANLALKMVQVFEFIYDMGKAYSIADLVVSRAGAMSIAEITFLKKPAILVPYPFAAEDHQTKNAKALVLMNAAILVNDANVVDELFPLLIDLVNDDEALANLSNNLQESEFGDATNNILDQVRVLIQ